MKFNPSKYSSSNEQVSSHTNDEKNSIDVSNEVVEKGHKNILKVDVGKFETLCQKFREKKDLKIKKLSVEDKADFDLMVSYVHLLYGTSYYNHLYDKVKKYFKNVTSVKPGTIGAYFAGCLVSTEKKGNFVTGCSVSCAGSMPLPKEEEGWSFCDKAVILAEKGEKGYIFSLVKQPDSEKDLDPAYLFLETNSLGDFKGFSQTEKDDLKALGCKKVKLIGYSNDLTYSEIYKEPKNVNEIKHRHVRSEKHKSDESEDESWLLLLLLLLAFFIIIILLLAYKYYSKK